MNAAVRTAAPEPWGNLAPHAAPEGAGTDWAAVFIDRLTRRTFLVEREGGPLIPVVRDGAWNWIDVDDSTAWTREGFKRDLRPPVAASSRGSGSTRNPLRLARVGELLEAPPPMRWLVRGWLPPEALALLFGDPAAGKSLVALDWAASVATGRAWNGCRVDRGPVVYLAGEGHHGIRRRLLAWGIHNGAAQELAAAPLFVSDNGAKLAEPEALDDVLAPIDEVAEEHGAPALIVIDTLHRNVGSGDENSAADMSRFVDSCAALRLRYGAAVLVVHHSGHGDKGRARGSSALRGAVDVELMVEASAGGPRVLSCPAKMKDAPKPGALAFNVTPVVLPWTDDEGEPETSVILAPAGCVPVMSRQRNAPPGVRLAFDALVAALEEFGGPPPGGWAGPTPPPPVVVHVDSWRPHFYARHPGDSQDSKRKAFQRARMDLVQGHAAGVWTDWYWIDGAGCQWPDLPFGPWNIPASTPDADA